MDNFSPFFYYNYNLCEITPYKHTHTNFKSLFGSWLKYLLLPLRALTTANAIVRRAKEKKNHESMCITNTKNKAKWLRATTFAIVYLKER